MEKGKNKNKEMPMTTLQTAYETQTIQEKGKEKKKK